MCAKLETKKQKRTRNSLIRFLFVKKKKIKIKQQKKNRVRKENFI